MSRLHPNSVAKINSKFADKCSIEWSESNIIALTSLKGIYMLKPCLERVSGPFDINVIDNPDVFPKHQLGKLLEIAELINNQQTYESFASATFLDLSWASILMPSNTTSTHPRYRCIAWSPLLQNLEPPQCYLASITSDFRLLVFAEKPRIGWTVLFDLSQLYDKEWVSINTNKYDLETPLSDFRVINDCLREVSFRSIVWYSTTATSDISSSKDHLYLLSSTRTNLIGVWKFSENTRCELFETIITDIDTKDEITRMRIYSNLLIVSTLKGSIRLFKLDFCAEVPQLNAPQSTNDIPSEIAAKTPKRRGRPPKNKNKIASIDSMASVKQEKTTRDPNLPNVLIKTSSLTLNSTVLLPSDGIEIADFFLHSIPSTSSDDPNQKHTSQSNNWRLVVAKSTYILWTYLNDSTTDANLTSRSFNNYESIDGCDTSHPLHQAPALSFCRANRTNRALLTAMDGSSYMIEFVRGSPQFRPIHVDTVELARFLPMGVCASPRDGDLIALVSCLNVMYDPQKVLAPTRFIVLPWSGNTMFLKDCIDSITNEERIASESINSPLELCSKLDYIASLIPLLTFEHYQELFIKLRTAANECVDITKNAHRIKLIICIELLTKLLSHKYSKFLDIPSVESELNALHILSQLPEDIIILDGVEIEDSTSVQKVAPSPIPRNKTKEPETSKEDPPPLRRSKRRSDL